MCTCRPLLPSLFYMAWTIPISLMGYLKRPSLQKKSAARKNKKARNPESRNTAPVKWNESITLPDFGSKDCFQMRIMKKNAENLKNNRLMPSCSIKLLLVLYQSFIYLFDVIAQIFF